MAACRKKYQEAQNELAEQVDQLQKGKQRSATLLLWLYFFFSSSSILLSVRDFGIQSLDKLGSIVLFAGCVSQLLVAAYSYGSIFIHRPIV